MGSSQSDVREYGFIFVRTEQPFYIAGELVTGCVYLNIIKPYPGNTIYLRIKGHEESIWHERRTRSVQHGKETRTQSFVHTHRGKNTFYQHQVILYQFMNVSSLPTGQYTFPFSFMLSSNLPGSFFEANHDYEGRVQYKIKTLCSPIGKKMGKIKHKQELAIREPLQQIVSSMRGDMTVNPTTWCCLSKGTSRISCFFQRNSYLPGETAQIFTEIDNTKCTLAVKRIECQLIQNITLTFNNGNSHNVVETVNSFIFEGIGAGQQAEGESVQATNITLGQPGQPLNPSTNGQFVGCQYSLQVKAVLEGCTCCSASPEVNASIQILCPLPIGYGAEQAPSNWSPHVYDVKTFVLTNDYMYTGSKLEQSQNNYGGGSDISSPLMQNPAYNQPPQQYGGQPPQQYGGQPPQQYGGQPPSQYGGQPQPQYGGQPQPQYGGQPYNNNPYENNNNNNNYNYPSN